MTEAFFVGLGAQKTGTSWLWEYLQSHPEVGASPIKEMHFFDSKYTAAHRGANRDFTRARVHVANLLRFTRRHPGRGARMIRHYPGLLAGSEASYRRFLAAARDGKRIAGEITPSYTMLGADGIAAIERTLDKPRYLLILRNPADRFWSQVRFRARWQDDSEGRDDLIGLLDQETYRLRSSCLPLYRELDTIIAGDLLRDAVRPEDRAGDLRRGLRLPRHRPAPGGFRQGGQCRRQLVGGQVRPPGGGARARGGLPAVRAEICGRPAAELAARSRPAHRGRSRVSRP